MNHESTPTPPTKRRRFSWPIIVVTLLGGHATIIITAVTLAVGGTGRGVVPDYYRQAVDFDRHKADLAASAKLGWTVTLTPGSLVDAEGRRVIQATLTDAEGQPIDNAAVQLRLIRLVDGQAVEMNLNAHAQQNGRYEAVAEVPVGGWYQADLLAERGDDRFVLQQEIRAVGGLDPRPGEGAS
ncbi:MAG: FixH family protein [Planctomycetota bacterium]